LTGDQITPLDSLRGEFPTMLSIVEGGSAALARVRAVIDAGTGSLPLESAHLIAPIERPGKFLAIGMNYRKHITEAARLGIQPPKNQFWFNKQTSCIVGPYEGTDPGMSERLDYEVELCVIIGRAAKHVSEESARDHVFGYMVTNDISARDWQAHSPTFTIGKSFDTHGPIGPWIVTADEIVDPHQLTLRCLVNGEVRQKSTTSEMIYNIWQQISYLSSAFTLEPGDLLATGTPEGVGVAMRPPQFLMEGDVVRCEIDGIGAIENKVATPVV
jgi:2-keto-4-pentenoate hydratase/2-oxohepta-3-ene-1,7-dioic acid hydratase in catechol pathway